MNAYKQEIIDFMREDSEVLTLLHHTSKENAEKAMKKGFMNLFISATSDWAESDEQILGAEKDRSDRFGKYTVVLGFGKPLLEKYRLKIIPDMPLHTWSAIDNIGYLLCEDGRIKHKEGRLYYVLSNKFVKGYCNISADKIVPNTAYKPDFDCQKFEDNIPFVKAELEFRNMLRSI